MSAGCTSGICCVTQLLLLLSSTCCLYLSPLSVSLSWHFQRKHNFSTFLPFLPSFYTKLKSFVTYAKDLITAYSHNKRLSPLYTKGTSRTQREDSKRNLAATWHHLLIWGKSLLDKSSIFIFYVLHFEGVQKCLIFSNHRSRNFHYQWNPHLVCSRKVISMWRPNLV